jgi:hypothetical protein
MTRSAGFARGIRLFSLMGVLQKLRDPSINPAWQK